MVITPDWYSGNGGSIPSLGTINIFLDKEAVMITSILGGVFAIAVLASPLVIIVLLAKVSKT